MPRCYIKPLPGLSRWNFAEMELLCCFQSKFTVGEVQSNVCRFRTKLLLTGLITQLVVAVRFRLRVQFQHWTNMCVMNYFLNFLLVFFY